MLVPDLLQSKSSGSDRIHATTEEARQTYLDRVSPSLTTISDGCSATSMKTVVFVFDIHEYPTEVTKVRLTLKECLHPWQQFLTDAQPHLWRLWSLFWHPWFILLKKQESSGQPRVVSLGRLTLSIHYTVTGPVILCHELNNEKLKDLLLYTTCSKQNSGQFFGNSVSKTDKINLFQQFFVVLPCSSLLILPFITFLYLMDTGTNHSKPAMSYLSLTEYVRQALLCKEAELSYSYS